MPSFSYVKLPEPDVLLNILLIYFSLYILLNKSLLSGLPTILPSESRMKQFDLSLDFMDLRIFMVGSILMLTTKAESEDFLLLDLSYIISV